MRRILLPLDGSELASRAIPFAATLAAKTDQSILLLRAVDAPGALTEADITLLEQDATDALAPVVQFLAAQGIRTETRVISDPPDVAILDAAGEPDTGLVVMSTHGRGGLDRWLHGSIADAVLRDAPVPVLVVPPQGLDDWSAAPPKVFVALDGSDRARATLEPARDLAVALGGSLVLASVVPFPQYVAYAEGYAFIEPDPGDVALAEMRAYLEEVAATLRTETLAVDVAVTYGSPYSGITVLAEDSKATLIVMATHGRGGVARALLGSVATATIRQTTVPVLLVRPGESQPTRQSLVEAEPAPAAGATEVTAPVLEPAAAPSAPVEAAVEPPMIALSLSADELELLTRTLGQQFHNEPIDPRRAEPDRALLEKLRKARAGFATTEAAMGRLN